MVPVTMVDEVCESRFDFVAVGGALDGSAAATVVLEGGAEFYFDNGSSLGK